MGGTIFVGFLLATDPRATGQTIHEWLGIAFRAGIVTHLLLHWKWIVNVVRRFFSKEGVKQETVPRSPTSRTVKARHRANRTFARKVVLKGAAACKPWGKTCSELR